MKYSYMILCVVAFSLSFLSAARAEVQRYDVVVYGGSSAGVTAAVQAARMGKSVVIVSPDKHLGGLSSGGLGYTDSGQTRTIGGLAKEFYHRVYEAYRNTKIWRWEKRADYGNVGQGSKAMFHEEKTMWIFEPHVAEAVFDAWVAEWNIPVVRDSKLDRENGVKKNAARIVSIKTLDGATFEGKMFIDATYEGDLMAAAGVDYRVGRESNDEYGETWNGNQVGILHHLHWFQKPVDPYVVPGDPSSGRLKYVDDSKPGVRGEGDRRVQAYCFRMCLTDHEPNRVPFPKPEGYDPADYELMLRVLETGWREMFAKFDRIPNLKTDTNNHGPFSCDFIGMNYDYPEASYERRGEIVDAHRRYQLGLMYFLANDPRVPEDVREAMSRWGLAKDEFVDNDHWPYQIYVREARRMVGEFVMTEHECLGTRPCPRPVGVGSYTLDSHNVRRYVTPEGHVQNEGDIGVYHLDPYGIDFHALVPKRAQCTNLLVPVCLGATHVAFGSIRMEPVFMILGQSAATAGVMAIDKGIDVQEVEYATLKERLLADGQALQYVKPPLGPTGIDPATLAGRVVDNDNAKLRGLPWTHSIYRGKYIGSDFLHDNNEGKGKRKYEVIFRLPEPGKYDVRISYVPHANRATNVPVRIIHREGTSLVRVDQTNAPPIDGLFLSLGTFDFDESITVTVTTEETDGFVCVDAVQVVRQSDAPLAEQAGKDVPGKDASDPWTFTPDPSLPNVLLLGDSISIGYTLPVRKLLSGKANVFRPMTTQGNVPRPENCGDTLMGIRGLDRWLDMQAKWDVIHFNWGLWDLSCRYPHVKGRSGPMDKKLGRQAIPPEEYAENLEKIVQRLKRTGAKLVWRSTTYIPPDTPGRFEGDDAKYNAVAAKVMEKHGIPTDDVLELTRKFDAAKFRKPGDVHYSLLGYEMIAEQVAEAIAGQGGRPEKAFKNRTKKD